MILKADCVYIPALNAKNALKKYHFNKNQTAYYSKPPIMNL